MIDEEQKSYIIRKLASNHDLKVGDYVGCRYADREGYIRRVVFKQATEYSQPYGVLEVRAVDGYLFQEHAEHLVLCEPQTIMATV